VPREPDRLRAARHPHAVTLALLGYLYLLGELPTSPPAARHLRAMKDRAAAPAAYDPLVFADFEALPHGRPPAEVATLEARGVSLEGYVQTLLRASDGDVHLGVVAAARPANASDEIYVSAEITPQWQRGSKTWRYEPLLAALRPDGGGATAWDGGPRRARLSGWLLYDYQYDGAHPPTAPERLRLLGPTSERLTGWEIHPVTRIELWSDARGAWEEYRR
jgi:hypothetical protein